jgi:hypothetical protein
MESIKTQNTRSNLPFFAALSSVAIVPAAISSVDIRDEHYDSNPLAVKINYQTEEFGRIQDSFGEE